MLETRRCRPQQGYNIKHVPDDDVVVVGVATASSGRLRLGAAATVAAGAVSTCWRSLLGDDEAGTWAGQTKPRPQQQLRQRWCAQPAMARSQQSWHLMIPPPGLPPPSACVPPLGGGIVDDDAATFTGCCCC